MIITEAEAATKTCVVNGANSFGADFSPDNLSETPVYACVGSRCMAWRREIAAALDDNAPFATMKPSGRGWCGLAGPPS